MLVQIYGITTVEDAIAVDRIGVDHVGVVLDEGIGTWDSVDEATARGIASSVATSRVVALSLSTEPDRVMETAGALGPDVVHLARAHLMSTEVLGPLRDRLAPSQLMLTVPVRDETALDEAVRLGSVADFLLLDTEEPATGVVGATGLIHDWGVSARLVEVAPCPVILAGGLGPENVTEAIGRVRPAGVDSETRTSRDDDRRRKDLDRVRAFVGRARRAAVEHPRGGEASG